MKLADRSETVPFFLDQAAIALMQLSINHLQLLETMAEELQALTVASTHRPVVQETQVERKADGQAAEAQEQDGRMEIPWDR